jgi:folate-binding protein YgfZ
MVLLAIEFAYQAILVQGVDAASFLNGQLTINIPAMIVGQQAMAGYCNHQGRLLAVLQVTCLAPAAYQLCLPASMASGVMAELQRFVLRARLQLLLGEQKICTAAEERAAIEQKIPEIYPATSGKFLAPALGLEALGAIALDKGCYRGQEILARLKFRSSKDYPALRVGRLSQATLPAIGEVTELGQVLRMLPQAEGVLGLFLP